MRGRCTRGLPASSPLVALSAPGFVRYVFSMDGALAALLGVGSVSGAGAFGSTAHVPIFGDVDLPMTRGSRWELKVGLLAQSAHTSSASFLSTARLVDVQLFDAAHGRIADFTLGTASGTDYLAPVPEPATCGLWLLGPLAVSMCRGQATSNRSRTRSSS